MSFSSRVELRRRSIGPRSAKLLPVFISTALLTLCGPVHAQESHPPFRFGAIFGVNYNMINLDDAGIDYYDPFGPRNWNASQGDGAAPYIGGFFSYVPGTFGLQARAAYNGMGGTFVHTTPADISTDVAYFSLAPALRISASKIGLHFLVGPSFDFEVSNGIRFPNALDPTTSNEIPVVDLKANMISIFGGVGYDITLSRSVEQGARTAWLLTPFLSVQYAPEQSGNIDGDWSTTTIRGGMQIAYAYDSDEDGIEPRERDDDDVPAPAVTAAGIDLEVEPPGSMLDGARDIDEFFPLLNYLFYPKSSSQLPDSYRLLTPRDAALFSEQSLMREGPSAGPEAGKNRAARQLRVYDNVLNVIGARMRKHPGSSIELVGADPDPTIATDRAEGIKSYLVSTFGIDPGRIRTRGVTRAPHASGTRSTPREDLGFIAEENRRVEILSTDHSLLRPVRISSTEVDLLENDILFRLNLTSSTSVSQWDLLIESAGGEFRQAYGPFYSGIARINSTPLGSSGTFRATATGVTFEGDTVRAVEDFAVGASTEAPSSATRFSILFEYDDSKSVQTYEEFLRGEVAPHVPNGSTVYVFGHTDLTGTEQHNRELSARRSSETETILGNALAKLGRSVRFDTYGFGETPFRAPFGNASPEERYYNRTVVIEIVPPTP